MDGKLKLKSTAKDKTGANEFKITAPAASIASATPTVTWGSAGSGFLYDLKIGITADCAAPLQTYSGLSETSNALTTLADGSYFICLAAKDPSLKAPVSIPAGNTGFNFTVDTKGPAINFTNDADTFVKSGDTQTLQFNIADTSSAIASLTWAYAENGTSFGAETAVDKSAGSLGVTIPVGANSVVGAKIRLTATDVLGNVSKVTTAPFQIATSLTDLYKLGTVAYGYADGTAFQARYNQPFGVHIKGTDMYVADNSMIRKVNLTDGSAVTLAGYPSTAYQDGIGRAARFNNQRHMTSIGNYLYITDYGNHLIRKMDIDPASANYLNVTTLAGVPSVPGTQDGTGSGAKFYFPYGITTDGTYLYVADAGSHIIRKVDPTTGAVVTIAGTASVSGSTDAVGTAARFSAPRELVYDSGTASLYISDINNYCIRKIVLSSMTVSTFSGTLRKSGSADGPAGTAQFLGTAGITTDGTYLYLVDYWAHTIRRIALSDGSATTISGIPGDQGYAEGNSATAKYSLPLDLTYSGGFLYIADSSNSVLRKLDLGTNTTTLLSGAPFGTSGFDPITSSFGANVARMVPPFGFSTTDGNEIYFTQYQGNNVRKMDIAAGTITTIAGSPGTYGIANGNGTAARFRSPWGIVKVGTALYVADFDANNIRKIDLASSNAVTIVAGSASGTAGNTDDPIGTNATFNGPRGMDTDGTYLYVADFIGNRIRRVTIGGNWNVTTVAGGTIGYLDNTTGLSARFNGPIEVAVNGTDLYVSEQTNNAIRKVDLSSSGVTTIAGGNGTTANGAGMVDGPGTTAKFNLPRKVLMSGGSLYVADYSNSRIRKINLSTNTVSTVLGGATSLYSTLWPGKGATSTILTPTGMTAFGGVLYFGSGSYFHIRSYDTNSDFSQVVAGISTNNILSARLASGFKDGAMTQTLNMPSTAIVVGSSIYLGSYYNYAIQKMNLDGSGLTVVAGSLSQPGTADGVGTAARLGPIGRPVSDGKYLYFADYGTNTIRRMSLADYTVDTLAGASGQTGNVDGSGTAVKLGYVGDLAIANGDIYFGDKVYSTIRKLSLHTGSYGAVTTIAGTSGTSGYSDGPFSSALFNGPTGMVAIGNALYMGDGTNFVIRKIDLSTSKVSTLAGTAGGPCDFRDGAGASAKFCTLGSMVTDGTNILMNDTGNNVIRKIRVSDGTVSSFFGIPAQGRDPVTSSLVNQTMMPSSFAFAPGVGLIMINNFSVKLMK